MKRKKRTWIELKHLNVDRPFSVFSLEEDEQCEGRIKQ